MICTCCNGTGSHRLYSWASFALSNHQTVACGPCKGTGDVAYHGRIEIGPGSVTWEGDMPSMPRIDQAWRLALALKSP